MKEKMEAWMETLTEETTVKKRELALGAAVCTLAGMVVGILLVNMTSGLSWSLSIMSNNGNENGNDNGNYHAGSGEDAREPKHKKKCREKEDCKKEAGCKKEKACKKKRACKEKACD